MLGTFRAMLLNHDEAQTTLTDTGATEGIAAIRVAVFDIPDTHVATGLDEVQVIDRGSFSPWVGRTDFLRNPVPLFIDHGHAMLHGYALADRKLGFANDFGEEEDGLVNRSHYNLRTQRGRESFADLAFDPFGTQYSFRTPPDERTKKGDDGFTHVIEFSGVTEVSQVGFGAQREAGLTDLASISMRAAIASHGTGTDDGEWSASLNFARCPDSAAPLRRLHAWADPDGDPDAKASYKFPHHSVADGGVVGAASIRACTNAIAVLNGARGGSDIPDLDRPGVYRHLARHLQDAGKQVADLRASYPERGDLEHWLSDEAFAADLAGWLASLAPGTPLTALLHTGTPIGSDFVAVMRTLQPTTDNVWAWLNDDGSLNLVASTLRARPDLRERFDAAMTELDAPDPLAEFYKKALA